MMALEAIEQTELLILRFLKSFKTMERFLLTELLLMATLRERILKAHSLGLLTIGITLEQ